MGEAMIPDYTTGLPLRGLLAHTWFRMAAWQNPTGKRPFDMAKGLDEGNSEGDIHKTHKTDNTAKKSFHTI